MKIIAMRLATLVSQFVHSMIQLNHDSAQSLGLAKFSYLESRIASTFLKPWSRYEIIEKPLRVPAFVAPLDGR